MRNALLTFFLLIFAFGVFAQSGRVKQSTEEQAEKSRPRIVYFPVQTNSETIKPKPTPTPIKPKVDEADDDGEIIRISSALVPIPASITDMQGRAITNLRIADFELLIDGQEAVISDISRSQMPVRLALLFDNSSSVSQAREFEKNAAIKFFRQVIRPEKDQAALFSVASVSRLEQPFTKNVSQLVQAIEYFPKPEGATALLDGIVKAADYLKGADGRRVIVIVSDGEDNVSDASLEETVKSLQANNCQVYIVKTTDFENFKQNGIRTPNANVRFLAGERRMQEIGNQTGGAVYSPIDEAELDAAFARISAELAQQYILNYYPEDTAQSGEFRTIALRVRNKKDLTVRTRKGYYVPRTYQ